MGWTFRTGNRNFHVTDGKYRAESKNLASGNFKLRHNRSTSNLRLPSQMNGAAVASGMGTCGLVGQIGIYTGWINDIASGTKAAITPMDWIGMLLVCFILPGVLTWAFGLFFRKIGWIKENDLKLDL